MPLPEGRKPLTDGDMITLLHNMAMSLAGRDETLSEDLRSTADRLAELEANLAWAMEGLPQMKSDLEDRDYNSAYHVCKHILEQLTGGKDD